MGCGSYMVAIYVNVVTLFFFPGVSANCGHLSVSAPRHRMEALSGSCLYIPCSFSVDVTSFKKEGILYGMWLKNSVDFATNPNVVVFNSSKKNNVYPIKILGNLSQNNCSTLFSNSIENYTGHYFFRIVQNKFKATAECNAVQINVQDFPQKPRIKISDEDLKENQSVTISCSASTPCPQSPPKLTWNLQQDSPQHTEENTDGSFTTKIQQSITLSHTRDGYTITCSAAYPVDEGIHVKTSETQETLSVSYAPKNTSASISPSGLVPAGSLVELSCSSKAKPPVNSFTWFNITEAGNVKVHEGQVYLFTAKGEGLYFCMVINYLGDQTSQTIQLNIVNTEDSSSSLLVIIGGVSVMGISFLVACVCIILFWRKTKAQRSAEEQIQIETSHQQLVPNLQGYKEEKDEILHYEEVEFKKKKTTPASLFGSVQDDPAQETVYANIKVSEAAGRSKMVTDSACLYATVKSK